MKKVVSAIVVTIALTAGMATANAGCRQASRFPVDETGPTFPAPSSGLHEPFIRACAPATVREQGDGTTFLRNVDHS